MNEIASNITTLLCATLKLIWLLIFEVSCYNWNKDVFELVKMVETNILFNLPVT